MSKKLRLHYIGCKGTLHRQIWFSPSAAWCCYSQSLNRARVCRLEQVGRVRETGFSAHRRHVRSH